jgi:lysophospholipase L1-like esterase
MVTRRQLLISFAATVAIPALLLLDTAIALFQGWSTRSRLDYFLIGLFLVVALLAILALAVPRTRRFYQTRYRQMLLLVGIGSCTWMLAELVLGPFLPVFRRERIHHHTPATVSIFHPQPDVMPGIEGSESLFTTNSLGLRGPELPTRDSAYRILCVGGSTTECPYIDDSHSWPWRVMQALNQRPHGRPVWIGNAGMSGFSTVEHLAFLESSSMVSEMDCLMFMVGVNDLCRSLSKNSTAEEERKAASLAPLWTRSNILGLVRRRWQATQYDRIALEDVMGAVYVVRRERRQAAILHDELPDLNPDLQEYAARIRVLIETCRRKGVRPVFMTQPMLWSNHLSSHAQSLLWLGWIDRGNYCTAKSLSDGIGKYNATLQDTCEQLGVECIDLSPLNGQESLFFDDCHFNDAGSAAVATLLTRWFAQQGIPDR